MATTMPTGTTPRFSEDTVGPVKRDVLEFKLELSDEDIH
jgi:hypothetical protein